MKLTCQIAGITIEHVKGCLEERVLQKSIIGRSWGKHPRPPPSPPPGLDSLGPSYPNLGKPDDLWQVGTCIPAIRFDIWSTKICYMFTSHVPIKLLKFNTTPLWLWTEHRQLISPIFKQNMKEKYGALHNHRLSKPLTELICPTFVCLGVP